MSRKKIVQPCENMASAQIPPDAEVRLARGGGATDPFFAPMYVDDYLLIFVQDNPQNEITLTAFVPLASNHKRHFGPG